MNKITYLLIISISVLALNSRLAASNLSEDISFKASDKGKVYAYWNESNIDIPTATIVLFHQAGASARGEYKNIIPKLKKTGANILAVDLRSGGNRFGGENQTFIGHNSKKISYCDAYLDIVATIKWLRKRNSSAPVILWGSSYSAALVIKAGAEFPNDISAVMSFSPASGKPMHDCKPEQYLDKLKVPLITFRPEVEMSYGSVKKQAEIFIAKNLTYFSVENGVHGSSMLDSAQTKNDMTEAWKLVNEFIKVNSQ